MVSQLVNEIISYFSQNGPRNDQNNSKGKTGTKQGSHFSLYWKQALTCENIFFFQFNPNWYEEGHFPPIVLFGSDLSAEFLSKISKFFGG